MAGISPVPALPNRLDTVRKYIRNQAGLTDKNPPKAGPGRCELNHAEAMQVADWLDELAVFREWHRKSYLQHHGHFPEGPCCE
jgi:hypothetical protein